MRQYPSLACVEVQLDYKAEQLIVSSTTDASQGKLRIPFVAGRGLEELRVRIWGDEVMGQVVSHEADGWFSGVVGTPLRLVRIGDSFVREIPAHTRKPRPVLNDMGFGDGWAYLLTTTQSLAEVSRQAGESIDMRRFRPNIVVDNQRAGEQVAAFEEDFWAELSVGKTQFITVAPCSRCKVPRLDPDSGREHPLQHPTTALQALGHFYKSEAYFGIHVAHTEDSQGSTISIGDAVTLRTRFTASTVGK